MQNMICKKMFVIKKITNRFISCQIVQKFKPFYAIKRNFTTQRNQWQKFTVNHNNLKKKTPLGWFLLIIPCTSFGLGCWQIQRKKWKENLIQHLEHQSNSSPVEFPDNLEDLSKMEYCPIKTRGHFIHNKEIYMGPRTCIQSRDGEAQSALFSSKNTSIGYLIITPFKLEDREETILVNRGWVPKNLLDPSARQKGQIEGSVELIGIVRLEEPRPQFSPESKGNHFLYRDLQKMCQITGADPYFIDAQIQSSITGGPIGGQTRVTLRNEHLSYIITWFSLAALTSFMWYRQIMKRIPF